MRDIFKPNKQLLIELLAVYAKSHLSFAYPLQTYHKILQNAGMVTFNEAGLKETSRIW